MVYGLNEINVPISTIPALVLLDLLTPFFVFQIYSLAVWLNENYYYYAIAIIIMTIFGTASSVIQTHQVIIIKKCFSLFCKQILNRNNGQN